jgi:putative peptidoglycan lipid II flippase
MGFAVRAGYLELDKTLLRSTAKFLLTGVVLGAVLWFTARFAAVHLAQLSALRDEASLVLLIVVGAIVYAGSILLLFGWSWLKALVRN